MAESGDSTRDFPNIIITLDHVTSRHLGSGLRRTPTSGGSTRDFSSNIIIIILDVGRKWRFYARLPQHHHNFRSWQVPAQGATANCCIYNGNNTNAWQIPVQGAIANCGIYNGNNNGANTR